MTSCCVYGSFMPLRTTPELKTTRHPSLAECQHNQEEAVFLRPMRFVNLDSVPWVPKLLPLTVTQASTSRFIKADLLKIDLESRPPTRIWRLLRRPRGARSVGSARRGLWELYFYALAAVAWRGGERRLVAWTNFASVQHRDPGCGQPCAPVISLSWLACDNAHMSSVYILIQAFRLFPR
jgi:hypothetical protein